MYVPSQHGSLSVDGSPVCPPRPHGDGTDPDEEVPYPNGPGRGCREMGPVEGVTGVPQDGSHPGLLCE